jgi:hypothetical protein
MTVDDTMTRGEAGSRLAPDAPPSLARLVAAVERAHADHRVAFIAAGDEKIYAYGGNGMVAVVSEKLFDGLVELETPRGTIRIEPDADRRIAVTRATGEAEADLDGALAEAARTIDQYYARRYWR